MSPHCFISPLWRGDSTREECICKLSCTGHWERLIGNGGPTPTIKANLALSPFYESKALCHLLLVFLWRLWHQDTMGRSVWSLRLGLVTSVWYCLTNMMYHRSVEGKIQPQIVFCCAQACITDNGNNQRLALSTGWPSSVLWTPCILKFACIPN